MRVHLEQGCLYLNAYLLNFTDLYGFPQLPMLHCDEVGTVDIWLFLFHIPRMNIKIDCHHPLLDID